MLLTSLGKTFFACHFIRNGNIDFRVTASCQQPLVFTVSQLCFLIFTIIIHFMAKNGSDPCNFYSKLGFWIFVFLRNHFFLLFFCMDFIFLMFHSNTVKISEILNKGNLLKTCLMFTTQPMSAYFAAIFTMGNK